MLLLKIKNIYKLFKPLFSIRSGDSSVLTSFWERLFTNIVMYYEAYTKEGKDVRKSLGHT